MIIQYNQYLLQDIWLLFICKEKNALFFKNYKYTNIYIYKKLFIKLK